jgi:hypothetical protein
MNIAPAPSGGAAGMGCESAGSGIGWGGTGIGIGGDGRTCSAGGAGKLKDGQLGQSSGQGRQQVL